ncbi:hypothetical protein BGX38DRAFT_1270282 [Terfezia claveryi]|nr:hypothetical protein BGX38DRAFT_1270282 [Terfezia claveryi]
MGHYSNEYKEPAANWKVRQGYRDKAQKEAAEYRERRGMRAITAATAQVEGDIMVEANLRAIMAIAQIDNEQIKSTVREKKLAHICTLLTKIPKAQALVAAAAGEKRDREEGDENLLRSKKLVVEGGEGERQGKVETRKILVPGLKKRRTEEENRREETGESQRETGTTGKEQDKEKE